MPKSDFTDITVVLDRSGSMDSIKDDTIGGFNAFLDGQKKAPGSASLTLAQFDHIYEIVHAGVPIGDVPPLTAGTFVPRGGTALLDAIGRSINETGARLSGMPEADRPGKVVFVILTDGHENASREFSRDKVLEMVSHQRDAYAWTFVFLGANQDAIKVGASLGVASTSSMNFTGKNVSHAVASTSRNISAMRSGQAASFAYSEEDRAASVKS